MSVIKLEKTQRIDIGLRRVVIGLGWDSNKRGIGGEYDLDASAFMIDSRRKTPSSNFFVFYNNKKSPDNAVTLSGDNRSGGNSGGDDESIFIDLEKIDNRVQEIIIVVTIHEADVRRQNFGQIRNAFIRVFDMANESNVICKYELDEDFSVETAVEFGRIYKRNNIWKFEAVGVGYRGGIKTAVNNYVDAAF